MEKGRSALAYRPNFPWSGSSCSGATLQRVGNDLGDVVLNHIAKCTNVKEAFETYNHPFGRYLDLARCQTPRILFTASTRLRT